MTLWALPIAGAQLGDRDWDEFAVHLVRRGSR